MGNVVQLRFGNYVYEDIMQCINLADHSNNTKVAYEKGIRDFFQIVKRKDIEHITLDDLQIRKNDIEFFRVELQKKGLSTSTINNRVASVKKLYAELVLNDYDLDVAFLKSIKKLKENHNSHGFFTNDEIFWLINEASLEKNNPMEKSLFIAFCAETCVRKNAALQLKWNDFKVIDEDTVRITLIDKGEKQYRAEISRNFYEDILKLKSSSEFVFSNISISNVNDMMKRLLIKLNDQTGRNLTFHSLRKTGVDYKYIISGKDVRVAQQAANHSDINLTMSTYVQKDDFGVKGIVSQMKYDKDIDILEKLSLDQLRQLTKEIDKDLQDKLRVKASELFLI